MKERCELSKRNSELVEDLESRVGQFGSCMESSRDELQVLVRGWGSGDKGGAYRKMSHCYRVIIHKPRKTLQGMNNSD